MVETVVTNTPPAGARLASDRRRHVGVNAPLLNQPLPQFITGGVDRAEQDRGRAAAQLAGKRHVVATSKCASPSRTSLRWCDLPLRFAWEKVVEALFRFQFAALGLLLCFATATHAQDNAPADEFAKVVRTTEPLSPADEMATFTLPEGFKASLVVAEPDIAKPMNMAFDARGRLWVTTSEEYPIPAPADRAGKDRIVVLEDKDGDGIRETVTTFADGLNIPMGLYPYKDGVICFSIPNIWFLQDTDGDGKCDERKELYGPMGFERDTHGMCNGFTRGFDGWLYACHGFNNHTTVAGADGHEITMQSGNTFRFRLDGSRIEHFTHGLVNPFGMTQSPAADLFVADCHTKPVSLLLPGGYYESFGKPHDGLGYVPPMMDHLHGSTAIGGIAQYNADVFPAEYHGNTFGGNVMTGCVNRNSLQQIGSSFRAKEEADFLVSTDPWFRPMDLQVGPDGAMYIADFYNRIIGHYEVGLDHPGRDRKRGRIWKVEYQGNNGNTKSVPMPGESATPDELLAELASPNMPRRTLAMNRLLDSYRNAASPSQSSDAAESVDAQVHALWLQQRQGNLNDQAIRISAEAESELVRVHAFRIIADRDEAVANSGTIMQQGFRDASPLVRRAAVLAAAKHVHSSQLRPLIDLYHDTPAEDVYLQHSVRMALRNHLQSPELFQQLDRELTDRDIKLVAAICLALNTPDAGSFLIRHIRVLSDAPPDEFANYTRFAVRHVSAQNVGTLTAVVRERFADNPSMQLELLKAASDGLKQRGASTPEVIRNWAATLAAELIGLKNGKLPAADADPIVWSYVPYPGGKDQGSPFQVTHRRTSTDGMKETPLYSSLPKGEQQTGIYRSGSFNPGEQFSFYMAGHDGVPKDPAGGKNLVRLRDAATHETLHTWPPPRNDTAHQFNWTNTDDVQCTYIEVVDGDSGNAFAWLAVGRFSVEGLNPNTRIEQRREGIELIGLFQLADFRDVLSILLRRSNSDVTTGELLGKAIAGMQADSRFHALAAACGVTDLAATVRSSVHNALLSDSTDNIEETLGKVMASATSAQQLRVAEPLCSDLTGAKLLVALVDKGKASAELLRRPTVADALKAVADESLNSRVQQLLNSLPDQNAERDALIASRTQNYVQQPGSAAAGEAVFAKNCSVCHQVAGKGKKVGPNLDGIGSRGANRLIEDMLAPNRNVDIAFRTSTVVITSGKVASGLSRGYDGARLILIDSKGAEISIPRDDIEELVVSRRSPMPDNVAEILTEQQFRDLTAWLLSLRN